MGPGDPFANKDGSRAPSQVAAESASMTGKDRARRAPVAPLSASLGACVLVGIVAGLAFGLVVVLRGVLAALVLAVFAAVGATIAGAVWAAFNGKLDLSGALEALFRRGPR